MAYTRKRRGRKKSLPSTKTRAKQSSEAKSNKSVGIRRHSRSPRGPDAGKPRVRVPAYKRAKPKRT